MGEPGDNGEVLVIFRPEAPTYSKEFIIWVNLISDVLNMTNLAEKGQPGEEVEYFPGVLGTGNM